MNALLVENLFKGLTDDEVLRIELINGNNIYCLPSDDFNVEPDRIEIIKPIKKDKKQVILINMKSIAVICTMSRQTYELKLNRGELYV